MRKMAPGMAASGHYVKGFVCIVFFKACSNLVSKSFYFPIWLLTKPMVKWFAKGIPLASVGTWIWTQVFLVPYKHPFLLWRWKLSWWLFKAKRSVSWTTSKWSVMQLCRRLGLGEKKPDSIPSCLHPLSPGLLGNTFCLVATHAVRAWHSLLSPWNICGSLLLWATLFSTRSQLVRKQGSYLLVGVCRPKWKHCKMTVEAIHPGGSNDIHSTNKWGDCPPKSLLIIIVDRWLGGAGMFI